MRFQHPGKSTDGGKTFVWSSRNLDYSEIRSIAYHRTDSPADLPRDDRPAAPGERARRGLRHRRQDHRRQEGRDRRGNRRKTFGHTASGTLLLDRGTRTGYVAQVGNPYRRQDAGHIRPRRDDDGDRQADHREWRDQRHGEPRPAGRHLHAHLHDRRVERRDLHRRRASRGQPGYVDGRHRADLHASARRNACGDDLGRLGRLHRGRQPRRCSRSSSIPIATQTVLNPATKNVSFFGQVNPAVGYRGISGRHVFEMDDGRQHLARSDDRPSVPGLHGPERRRRPGFERQRHADAKHRRRRELDDLGVSALGNFSGRGFPIVDRELARRRSAPTSAPPTAWSRRSRTAR